MRNHKSHMAPKAEKTPTTEIGTGLSLKLLVDNKLNRVMFAEAGKDVIDFLFSLLRMPLGSIVRLLTAEKTPGCIGSVYECVEGIDDSYIQPHMDKKLLLKPQIPSVPLSQNASLLTMEDIPPKPETKKYYYGCPERQYSSRVCNGSWYVTDSFGYVCPGCNRQMTAEMKFLHSSKNAQESSNAQKGLAGASGKGYVKEAVTYMVMDDLKIMPTSNISGLALLKKSGIKDIGSLQEMIVAVGMEQGLELLRASLASKTVLTDIFLGKEKVNKRKK